MLLRVLSAADLLDGAPVVAAPPPAVRAWFPTTAASSVGRATLTTRRSGRRRLSDGRDRRSGFGRSRLALRDVRDAHRSTPDRAERDRSHWAGAAAPPERDDERDDLAEATPEASAGF